LKASAEMKDAVILDKPTENSDSTEKLSLMKSEHVHDLTNVLEAKLQSQQVTPFNLCGLILLVMTVWSK